MDARTARALGTGTRAAIYQRLRELDHPQTVADVAEEFNLHPNVARTHLEKLAELGLATVGQRKHPGGGRPAKLYDATDPQPGAAPVETGNAHDEATVSLLVRLLAELAERPASRAGPPHPLARAHEVAAAEGRRLVGSDAVPAESFRDGVERAVAGLARSLPAARVLGVDDEDDAVDIEGVDGAFRVLAVSRPRLARALERGLLSGALLAADAPASIGEVAGIPGCLRVRPAAPTTSERPTGRVDARGEQREAGVEHAKRTIDGLRPGEVIEVLAEGPGSPAAFARWADRAGHQLLSVERAADTDGRAAIRLLIRRGG